MKTTKILTAIIALASIPLVIWAANPNCTIYQNSVDCQPGMNKTAGTCPTCPYYYTCDVNQDITCPDAYDEARDFDTVNNAGNTVPYVCHQWSTYTSNCSVDPTSVFYGCGTYVQLGAFADVTGVCWAEDCSGSCD